MGSVKYPIPEGHIRKLPQDPWGVPGYDSGSRLGLDVQTVGTSWTPLTFPIDIKKMTLLVTAGTLLVRGLEPLGVIYLAADAVVNAGGGNVSFTTGEAHGLTVGDTISIVETAHYDGDYVLQTGTTGSTIVIPATYVAETPPTTAYVVGFRDASFTVGQGFNSPVWVNAMDTTWCLVKASSGTATFQVQVAR